MINVILKNNLIRCLHALHCLILPKTDAPGDDYNLENNLDNQS